MNYRLIKQLRDKLQKEIEGLKMIDSNTSYDKILKEKKKQYNFYNNLLKSLSH